MAETHTAHTADLDAATLRAIRALMDRAFEGDFDDHDWDHALGGLHALVWEDGELVAHASLVQRRLLHGGRALRAGYVEAVAVDPRRRRHGYGAEVMAPLERVIRGAYEVGGLAASEMALRFYAALGWQRWEGPTSALTPGGVIPTPDDDGIFVLPVTAELDRSGELTCDYRDGSLW
jgi:aminoglycoside 2'-N-acetyltransferase I